SSTLRPGRLSTNCSRRLTCSSRIFPQPLSSPWSKILDEHVSLREQLVDNLPGLRVLEIKGEALLGAIEPDKMARHPLHRFIVVTGKVPYIWTLDLYNTCSQVGQLARR